MSSLSTLFLKRIAQTGPAPAMVEVDHAEGIYLFDTSGKRYTDLNSGYCVSAMGHCHPRVVAAIQEQAARYMHTSVYGEHIQSPQVRLAELLASLLDASLDNVFFVNSGAEAVEGAMKLARRVTGRPEIVSCHKSYHGSTQGADSLRSDIEYTSAFMPLLPGIRHLHFSASEDLDRITSETAAVILEPVQSEAGVRLPAPGYLQALRRRCDEVGALLIFDEIQTGMGRTGVMFAYQQYGVIPDILLLAKALGGGMPLGALISRSTLLDQFTHDPAFGHLTTFGGHPVCCAAALAALETLIEGDYLNGVEEKSRHFLSRLQHPVIREVRAAGLLMAVELGPEVSLGHFVRHAQDRGIVTDQFLFDVHSFRIAPPLIITHSQIDETCDQLLGLLDEEVPA